MSFIRNLIFFLSIFLVPLQLAGEGFIAGTKVLTPYGKKAIEELAVGDEVISFNFKTKTLESTFITATYTKVVDRINQITVDNEVIESDTKQQFYTAYNDIAWITAEHLQRSDFLFKGIDRLVRPNATHLLEKEIELFYFSLNQNYNFFITDQEILVHNFEVVSISLGAWGAFTISVEVVGGIILACFSKSKVAKQVAQCVSIFEEKTPLFYTADAKEKPKSVEELVGNNGDVIDVTWVDSSKGSRGKEGVKNLDAPISKEEFEKNLIEHGWVQDHSQGGGKANVFINSQGQKISTRPFSKSTKGPTAEYHAGNSKTDPDIKIRFAE